MEHLHSNKREIPADANLQGDAQPIESDRLIWLTVDGEGPFTLHELILANMEPDVIPLAARTAAILRTLEIGETYEDFGDAPISRVPPPEAVR